MKRKFTVEEIAQNPALLSSVLKLVRDSGSADQRFDLNLAEGKEMEGRIRRLLTGEERIEVKRDFKVSQTGNIAIEFECYEKPSGINTTESDWYAIALDGESYEGQIIIFITTERLRRLVDSLPGKIMRGGDNNASRFKLLSLERLLIDEYSIQDYEDYIQCQRKKKSFVLGARKLKK